MSGFSRPGDILIPTEEKWEGETGWHYQIVVLRDDQLDLIRKIVRDEIRQALAEGGSRRE